MGDYLIIYMGGLIMKIVGFVGSPRKGGNTEILVKEVLKGANESGAETEIVNLNNLDIKPCQACMHCKSNNGECATDDDMQAIYNQLKESDAVVIGSPIYMWQMSAQTKLFTDRLYAAYGLEKEINKKDMVLVFSQGSPDENAFDNYINSTKDMFEIGFNVKGVISSYANQAPGDVNSKVDVLQNARKIGKNLVN